MDRLLAPFRNFWLWLNKKDPRPGINSDKIVRLLVKAFLFATAVNVLLVLLAMVNFPYIKTFWGQMVVMFLVYIPFLRWFMIDMGPPRQAKTAPGGKDKKFKKTEKKRKFAGVKGNGPRLR